MVSVNLKSLIRQLNSFCRKELENAAGFSLMRTNFNIEIEHWLKKLISSQQTDIPIILSHYGIDIAKFEKVLDASIDRFKTGNVRPPSLSAGLVELIKQTWLFSSIELGANSIRSGHLLICIALDSNVDLGSLSDELKKLPLDDLRRDFDKLTRDSTETSISGQLAWKSTHADEQAFKSGKLGETLAQFTIDLVDEAKSGRIDPIHGRDEEIRQIIDILSRRRQNNPILAGEAGVGKTAVVEGFALRIAAGDVPESLRNVSLRSLDLGLMQAGAGVKGEFEKRLHAVIDEVKKSTRPIILFIDEAHTLIGAGGSAGMGDAANLLKPALARGELRTIAATTWAEYKKYFEKDAALARRFQVIKVDEPSEEKAIAMIRGLAPILEKSHNVRITEDAISSAVKLSARYIPSRQLPDKAVSVIDTACARVSVSQSTTPSAIEDRKRALSIIDAELLMLKRESLLGITNEERNAELIEEKDKLNQELEILESRWNEESNLTKDLNGLRKEIDHLHDSHGEPEVLSEKVSAYSCLSLKLSELQGEKPLIYPLVDRNSIADVVQNWTGIPTGKMQVNQINTLLNMRNEMAKRIVGQSHAIESLSQAITTSRAGLTDPRKPVGAFLMVGPSGVGKTETALTLSELLYGGENSITTINMSEFKEEHKVSLLMGSPPGYVGYGEGGILTEAVRRKPYSVILLDEMEKAHPGVQDVFFQVFDKGQMRDGEGRDIDFKNSLIIMTSNAGSDLISKLCADEDTAPDPQELASALKDELRKHFKDAFLGRLTVVPYLPLTNSIMTNITKLQLERIRMRLMQLHKTNFTYDDSIVDHIVKQCNDSSTGARNIENTLTRSLLPDMSVSILEALAQGGRTNNIHVNLVVDKYSYELS